MNERPDPFDVLQAVRPGRDDRPLEVGELADADELLARIVGSDATAAHRVLRRPRRRWAVAAGVAAGSLVVTSAAAGLWWRSRSADHRVLACYAAAATDADRFEMQIDAGDDPLVACAVLWTDGTFSTDGQPVSQVCSTRTGTAAVVPGDDASACSRAGLEPFDRAGGDGATLEDQETVDRLSSRLVQEFLDVCLDEEASRTAAESALRDEGLDDWSVAVSVPFSVERRCGAVAIDAAERTILIAAIPPEPGGG